MTYPLNMQSKTGYALANDESEHISLTAFGYEPAFVVADADPGEADDKGQTVAGVREQLDAAGVPYDRRLGLGKLLNLLTPAA